MGEIQRIYPEHFKSFKIRFTQNKVEDVTNENDQEEIILETHNRAHRYSEEKYYIAEKYYFPKMKQKVTNLVKQCKVCKEGKYDRHPPNPEITETPIPEYPGHVIHIDIFPRKKISFDRNRQIFKISTGKNYQI